MSLRTATRPASPTAIAATLVALMVMLGAHASAVETREAFAAGDVFAGSYVCGNAAWLLLHIHSSGPTQGSSNSATFHFLYPSSTQHGAYSLSGTAFGAHGSRAGLDDAL